LDRLIDSRRAKAAKEVHAHLASLSDAQLAKAGIDRAQLALFIEVRLR
jgi:hypothetical protein